MNCFHFSIENVHARDSGDMSLTTEQENTLWISLVVKWLRIHLAMQETPVQFLVQGIPSCSKATEPALHAPQSPRSAVRGHGAVRGAHTATSEETLLATARDSPLAAI